MFSTKRTIADATHFSSKWAPVVLRFCQLFIGDQAIAEAVTIETLAEHIRASGANSERAAAVPLLRRAFLKAVAIDAAPSQLEGPVVRAVTRLEASRRAVIVLLRGLSLDFVTVGQITGSDEDRVKRLCVDALVELRQLMDSGKEIRSLQNAMRETK